MAKSNHRTEYNVYNSNFGLCASVGQNEGKTAWVLNLQLAPKIKGAKEYQWDAGIRFQLTESEICDFFACISKRKDEFKAIRNITDGHKFFNLQKDSGPEEKLLLSMKTSLQDSRAMMVKLENPDRVKLSIFAFNCLMRNNGGVDQQVIYFIQNRIYS